MFSYFYHDMDQEEKEYLNIPAKQEQLTCDDHKLPVTMYSYPQNLFICQKCYQKLYDKSDCYSLSELDKPFERLYAGLLQYIEYGREAKLQKQINEHKTYIEMFKEDRYKYLTEYEKAYVDKVIFEVTYDLQMFWRRVEQMQITYRKLKEVNDFETLLLQYPRFSAMCYDFRDKYLSTQYLKSILEKKVDPLMRPIMLKAGICYMCVMNEAKVTCNNIKDQDCKVCIECAIRCSKHGYYCRLHANENHTDKPASISCELCVFEGIQSL